MYDEEYNKHYQRVKHRDVNSTKTMDAEDFSE